MRGERPLKSQFEIINSTNNGIKFTTKREFGN